MKQKVAIQGYYGSYHDIAARHYFAGQEIDIEPCSSFQEQFSKLAAGSVNLAVVAIENTLVGSILHNYSLLRKSRFKIRGEHKLRIQHNLTALPDVKIEDINEVHSHPMAIQQCESHFEKYPHIKLINSEDTAYSAWLIRKKNLFNCAAIASKSAAARFNLNILFSDIETNNRNFTRFLIIGPGNDSRISAGETRKATIVVTLEHQSGSLAYLLDKLAGYGLNLTKIQSLPLVGREWKYLFYIDLEFESESQLHQAFAESKDFTLETEILGEYSPALTTEEFSIPQYDTREVYAYNS